MINALLLLYGRQEFFFVIIQRISHNTCICYGRADALLNLLIIK
jgi:hypothetical protein